MEFKDYYKVMDVPRSATPDEVKRAYRRLARKFHPDVSKEPNAEERFKQVQEAYEVLKDPEKRAAYDQLGAGPQPGQQFRPPPDWGQGFEFRGAGEPNAGGRDEQFSDFFSSLFGRGSPFTRDGGEFQSRAQDHHARIAVTLEEAFAGGSRTLELQHPEVGADGQVTLKKRSLRVTIPAGVTEGQVLRLGGQAGAGGPGGGDLYLQIALEPHRLFELDGRDVSLSLPVAPWEAALGATVPVPTLAGEVELKIPAGARAGQKLRLRGRGLPGATAGDQYVVLRIVLPPATTPRAQELYAAMRDELAFDPRAELRGRHD